MTSWRWHGRRRKRDGYTRNADLCSRCAAGDHSLFHNELGCLTPLAQPPDDYVCQCDVSRSALPLERVA